MGADAPADHIIATIVAFTGSIALPLLLPFIHRFPRVRSGAVMAASLVSAVAIAVFMARDPFDHMHPKRLFVLHMENVCSTTFCSTILINMVVQITSSEQHLHIAASDGAPGFDALAHDIAKEFSIPGVLPQSIVMDDWNGDWDTIYPLSHVRISSDLFKKMRLSYAFRSSLRHTSSIFP